MYNKRTTPQERMKRRAKEYMGETSEVISVLDPETYCDWADSTIYTLSSQTITSSKYNNKSYQSGPTNIGPITHTITNNKTGVYSPTISLSHRPNVRTSPTTGMYYEVFAQDAEGIFYIDAERKSIQEAHDWVVVEFDSAKPLRQGGSYEIVFAGPYQECKDYAQGLNALTGNED